MPCNVLLLVFRGPDFFEALLPLELDCCVGDGVHVDFRVQARGGWGEAVPSRLDVPSYVSNILRAMATHVWLGMYFPSWFLCVCKEP